MRITYNRLSSEHVSKFSQRCQSDCPNALPPVPARYNIVCLHILCWLNKIKGQPDGTSIDHSQNLNDFVYMFPPIWAAMHKRYMFSLCARMFQRFYPNNISRRELWKLPYLYLSEKGYGISSWRKYIRRCKRLRRVIPVKPFWNKFCIEKDANWYTTLIKLHETQFKSQLIVVDSHSATATVRRDVTQRAWGKTTVMLNKFYQGMRILYKKKMLWQSV